MIASDSTTANILLKNSSDSERKDLDDQKRKAEL
jgi:hypothetical protein